MNGEILERLIRDIYGPGGLKDRLGELERMPFMAPGKMNHIEDGIDAIDDRLDDLETGIDSGMVDYSDASTITGWSSFTTKIIRYKVIGKMVFVEFNIAGTSDDAAARFTLPYARAGEEIRLLSAVIFDNGAYQATPGLIRLMTGLVQVYKDGLATVFTASGVKRVQGQFWYEMA